MERLTDINFRLGFDDSSKLPSYETIYEKLRGYENLGLSPKEIKEFMKDFGVTIVMRGRELKKERDYWHREAKKWCNELGEGRIGPLLYMNDERGKHEGN